MANKPIFPTPFIIIFVTRFSNVWLIIIMFFMNVGTLSGVHLFDHLLWSKFQWLITHYIIILLVSQSAFECLPAFGEAPGEAPIFNTFCVFYLFFFILTEKDVKIPKQTILNCNWSKYTTGACCDTYK